MHSNAFEKLTAISNLKESWKGLNKTNSDSKGVDGITIKSYENNLDLNLKELSRSLKNKSFSFSLLREVSIPKDKYNPSRGTRTLKIPIIKDRIVLKALQRIVAPVLIMFNAPFSFAYQEDKNVEKAISVIIKNCGIYKYVIEIDIVSYFDKIPIAELLRAFFSVFRYKSLKPLIQDAMFFEGNLGQQNEILEVAKDSFFEYDQQGIPQGSALSPILANFYLSPFDYKLAQMKIPVVRYADDLFLFTDTIENAEKTYKITRQIINKLGLDFHPLGIKSFIREINCEGIDCLGYRIEQNGHILPGKNFMRNTKKEIETITDPKTLGIGFKYAPKNWREDTILRRIRYLYDKMEGKAGAIRISGDCQQIMDINNALRKGCIELFSACKIFLNNISEELIEKLGIPNFKKIWKIKHQKLPDFEINEDKIHKWHVSVRKYINRGFNNFL